MPTDDTMTAPAAPSSGRAVPKRRIRTLGGARIERRDTAWALAYVAMLVVVPLVLETYQLTLLVGIGMGMGLAVSWNMLAQSGQISLGHAAFMGVGAYTTALLTPKAGLALSLAGIALAGAIGAVLGYMIALLTQRMPTWILAIVTLAVAETLRIVAQQMAWLTRGSLGLFSRNDIGADRLTSFRVIYGLVGVIILVALYIRRSKWHYFFNSTRLDPRAAQMSGIEVRSVRRVALVVSGATAGLIGGFYSLYIGFIEPGSAFSLHWSVESQVYPLLGGLYTFAGPIIGSLFGGYLEELARGNFAEFSMMLFGIILVGFILKAPGGLVGLWRSYRSRREAKP